MYPDKYLKDLESSDRRRDSIRNILSALLFLAGFAALGPLIHEFSHIGWLALQNCFNRFELGFGLLSGVYGHVTPYCYMEDSNLIVFYSIGYASTLTIGAILQAIGFELRKRSRNYIYATALGAGTWLSTLLSLGITGDIDNLASVVGISQSATSMATLFVVIGVFISSLKSLELLTRKLEGEEGRRHKTVVVNNQVDND